MPLFSSAPLNSPSIHFRYSDWSTLSRIALSVGSMIDKKELISTYLQQFGSHYQISRLLNPTLRIDDEFISHFFEQVVDQYGETFAITEEEKTEIERKIKSQYCIFQDEGAALVGDYEHDFMWYANLQAQTIETAKLMLLVNCTLIFLNKMD